MRIAITSIVAGVDDDIAVSFELCEGENRSVSKFWISIAAYTQFSLSVGESSQNVFDAVERESKIHFAYKKGLCLLGFGMQSKKRLQYKLLAKGCEAEFAREAIERLVENRLLVEEDSAVREAEKCVEKLWGGARIRAHLVNKGYSESAINEVFFALDDEGVDFSYNCETLIKKKYLPLPKDKKEMQKIITSLIRYGYSLSQIKAAMIKMVL